MKNTLKLILITFSLLSGLALNAISSEAIEVNAAGCQVLLVNDVHVDQKSALRGPKQRKIFLNNIKNLNMHAKNVKQRPFLIVEDMMHYDGQNKFVKQYIDQESLEEESFMEHLDQEAAQEEENALAKRDDIVQVGSVITNLMREAHNLNIDCYNAEVRQVKRVSKLEDFVTGNDVADEFENNRQQILNDLNRIKKDIEHDEVAKFIYAECMRIMDHCYDAAQDSIAALRATQSSLKNSNIASNNRYNTLHDTQMVDIRILMAWYHNRMKDNVIIIAGEAHIENVLKIFERLDYAVKRHGIKFPFNDDRRVNIVNNAIDFDILFKQFASIGNNWSPLKVAFNTLVSLIS